MAQLVKCLVCKPEVLSLTPSTYVRKLGMEPGTCQFRASRVQTEGALGLVGHHSSKTGGSLFNERPKNKEESDEERLMLTSDIHMRICARGLAHHSTPYTTNSGVLQGSFL